MRKIGIFLLIIFYVSCKKAKNNEEIKSNQQKVIVESNKENDFLDNVKKPLMVNYLKKDFIGIWAENKEENALFEITKDSIHYVESYDNPYFFEIKEDTLVIHFEENYLVKLKILKINKDSLIYQSQKRIRKLYNRMNEDVNE